MIGASLQKIRKSNSIPISTTIRLMKTLVWPVATYGSESWTLRKNEEIRLDAFEMKGLRRMLRVSWTAKKTNEWVLNTQRIRSRFAGVECAAGGAGRVRIRYDAGPKRPVVDRSTSRSQNDFNLHDFPLHAAASRGLYTT